MTFKQLTRPGTDRWPARQAWVNLAQVLYVRWSANSGSHIKFANGTELEVLEAPEDVVR